MRRKNCLYARFLSYGVSPIFRYEYLKQNIENGRRKNIDKITCIAVLINANYLLTLRFISLDTDYEVLQLKSESSNGL